MKTTAHLAPRSLVLLATALFGLALSSSAQGKSEPTIRRVTQPIRPAHLDVQTGTITRGAELARKGLGSFSTSTTLDNNDFSGFVGVDSGPGSANGPCEWIDAAAKGIGHTGGASGLLTAFQFGYCSAALDTLSGGPGGKARIGFRAGYLRGTLANASGPSGTDVGTFNLSGLPANTGQSSFFGGFSCYLLTVDFGTTPVVLQDGPIGWSWQFRDVGADGVLAATFPFLSCIQSCTGPGPDRTGAMENGLDIYCPAGSILQPFPFCSFCAPTYYQSTSMALREAEPIATSNTTFNGSGSNPALLTAVAGPALGQTWSVDLDCGVSDPTRLAIWRLSFLPPAAPTSSPWGEILVALTGPGMNFFGTQAGTVATLGGFPLPLDLSFYGSCWNIQGFCGDSPRGFLSNGITQTMGF